MVSPRLTTLTGDDDVISATVLVTVSAAVRTATPVVSVPVSVPTFVDIVAALKNVPPLVPAFTLKTNVRVDEPGIVVFAGSVHVTVPVAPAEGDVVGTASVPAPVL